MEDKVVDNEATKMILEKFSEDDVVYPRGRTEFFFKAFWIIGAGINFAIFWHFLGSKGIYSHFIAFVLGVLALKIYSLIPAYMDLAEDMGMVETFEEE